MSDLSAGRTCGLYVLKKPEEAKSEPEVPSSHVRKEELCSKRKLFDASVVYLLCSGFLKLPVIGETFGTIV